MENNKRYIGLTKGCIYARFSQHIRLSRNLNKPQYALSRAIAKYGHGAFIVELLSTHSSLQEACEAEREAIRHHNTFVSYGHGYNLTHGGDGKFFTESEMEKLKKRMKENNPMKCPEARRLSSEKRKGQVCANKGKKIPALCGPNNASYGKKQSREVIDARIAKFIKTYVANWPNGRIEEIPSLKIFCMNNNLNWSTVRKSIGKRLRSGLVVKLLNKTPAQGAITGIA